MPDALAAAGWLLITTGALVGAAIHDYRERTPTMTLLRSALAVPVRGWLWTAARRTWRHHTRRAWRHGADLLAMMHATTVELPVLPPWRTAPTPQQTETCPGCQGRRCRHWREGDDCRQVERDARPAYAAGLELPRPGRHTTQVRIAHWVHIDRLHQLRDRLGLPQPKIMVLP